jgi:protein-disulfide isomerase
MARFGSWLLAPARGSHGSPCRLAALVAALSLGAAGAAWAQVVAEVDGEKVTAADLQQAAGQALASLEQQAYRLKQQQLEQLIGERLIAHEADRRKLTVAALVELEITSKVPAATAEEVHALYEANKAQLPNSEAELKTQLENYLLAQKTAARRQAFVQSLQGGARVTVYLEAPAPFRAAIQGDGPSRGNTAAPVTIVEFEDFQCPYCKQVHQTVEKVLARYKDQIRIVHRDFPLETLHPAAWRTHEAARCAEEQGKFWEYRDLLYANAPAAAPEQLKGFAAQAGLDAASFGRCIDEARFKSRVQGDLSEGERLGVSGTPAFFINGRLLSGSQPESEFSRVIEEELAGKR